MSSTFSPRNEANLPTNSSSVNPPLISSWVLPNPNPTACFHKYFTPNSSVHRIGTRQVSRGDLFQSFKNTTLYGLNTIKYFGSKLWNTLPLFIRVSCSSSVFRSNLKTFFIDSYLLWYFYSKIYGKSQLLSTWYTSGSGWWYF